MTLTGKQRLRSPKSRDLIRYKLSWKTSKLSKWRCRSNSSDSRAKKSSASSTRLRLMRANRPLALIEINSAWLWGRRFSKDAICLLVRSSTHTDTWRWVIWRETSRMRRKRRRGATQTCKPSTLRSSASTMKQSRTGARRSSTAVIGRETLAKPSRFETGRSWSNLRGLRSKWRSSCATKTTSWCWSKNCANSAPMISWKRRSERREKNWARRNRSSRRSKLMRRY